MTTSEETNVNGSSGAILVMDDEAEVRDTTGKVLMRLGFKVSYAKDGQEAVEIYRKAKESGASYDLVIMDLTVPGGMGGKEALKKLQQLDPGVKAIVSSGYSNDPIMTDFKTHGFQGVVSKPYRIRDLSEAVFNVINLQSNTERSQ